MSKLKIVSKVRIGDKVYLQEELDPEVFRRIVEQKIVETMTNLGFERVEEKRKTA